MMNTQSHTLQPAAPAAPALSAGSVLAQVSSVLAVIVLLILACAWLARRLGFAPKRISSQALKVSASAW
nr:Flagellar biosynthetic protein FliP precursor [Candidatus Pantoea persica]